MLYVYGVVRQGHPSPTRQGVGRPPADVRLVESNDVAVAVSDAPDDLELIDEDARAHLHVLIDLLADGPVLPLRFGTAVTDEHSLRHEILEGSAAAFRGTLDALDDLVEVHVDVDDDEAETIAAIARSAPELRPSGQDLSAAVEVGQQVASALMLRRQEFAEQILERLRPLAVDDAARGAIRGPEDPVLRWAFLVRRGDLALFDDAVIAVRSEFPSLAFRYVGPLPAADFVDRLTPLSTDSADTFGGSGRWGW